MMIPLRVGRRAARLHLLPLLLVVTALAAPPLDAAVDPYRFDTPEQEATYKQLIEELRCLVCQNQNLADSNAELALDLRRQVKEMVTAGNDRDQVVDFMVDRYGDFVLYRPPMKATTLLLWFGPVLLFVIAAVTLTTIIRRRARDGEREQHLSAEEIERAERLLQDKDS